MSGAGAVNDLVPRGVARMSDVLIVGLMVLLLVSTLVWIPGLTRLMGGR
jgi:hypothetical protein